MEALLCVVPLLPPAGALRVIVAVVGREAKQLAAGQWGTMERTMEGLELQL